MVDLTAIKIINMNKRRLVIIISGVLLIALVAGVNYGGGCNGKKSSGSSNSTAPIVSTTAATNVTFNSAKLNGTVNPNGFDTTYHFYWESVGLGTINGTTTSQNLSAGTTAVNVSANVTSLSPQMGIGDYGYRIVATNSSGTSYGEFEYFDILP
ncbi:MAG: hypothetical protein V1709_10175 [Planctomycetota bacterium]